MKSWRIRAAIALCTASLVLGSCNGNNGKNAAQVEAITKDWVSYTPDDESYSVKFPGEPQSDQIFVGYEGDPFTYGVIAVPYPPEEKDADALIEEFLKTLTEGGGTVESQEDITRNGVPGKELTLRADENILKVLVLFDTENRRIYQVLVGSKDPEQEIDTPEANAFLSSFELADAPDLSKAAAAEGKTNLKALSRAQQAYYLESEEFAATIDDLNLGINPETENFNYEVNAVEGDRVYLTATAKKPDISSVGILVFIQESGEEANPQSILCVTDEPAQSPPDIPTLTDGEAECASGSSVAE
ncbi:MAG: type IV pilin-like G/H family protein [Jaaginema sp. PMC 1079.18]|nr:type IV pilin-like G/H family protein [Jaaginema sp. PMC 1080.18]MEC4852828.1 type IV pilin-like G/H family protein [Jaaginema sp. PMC 1079.18]MEC4868062.1 type IV pilin-like G/H family protein [Jaaginema sp. PMC 1078.18]